MAILICSKKLVGCGFVAEALDWELRRTRHGTVEVCPQCGMFGMVLTDLNLDLLTDESNERKASKLLNAWRRSLHGSELYLEYIVSHVDTAQLSLDQKSEIVSRTRSF